MNTSINNTLTSGVTKTAIASTGVVASPATSSNQPQTQSLFNNAAFMRQQELSDFATTTFSIGSNAQKTFSDAAWGTAASVANSLGTVDVTGKPHKVGSTDSQNPKLNEPGVFEGMNNLPKNIYGGEQGYGAYYGQNFGSQAWGSGNSVIQPKIHEKPENSLSGLSDQQWEETSVRMGMLFSDGEHMDKALAHTLSKLEDTPYSELKRDSTALAFLSAYNISKEGIENKGIGKFLMDDMKAYDMIPKGLLTEEAVQATMRGEQYSGRDHGTDLVSGNRVEAVTDLINGRRLDSLASNDGLNPSYVRDQLAQNNGFEGENALYQLNGNMHYANFRDSQMMMGSDPISGKSFQEMVAQAKEQNGGLAPKFTMSIYIGNNASADHGALAGSGMGRILGGSSLLKYQGEGLSSDPTKGNHLVFAFQSNDEFLKSGLGRIAQEMKEAGVEVTGLQFIQQGHGGEDGSTMLKEGVASDQNGFGIGDSKVLGNFIQSLAENNSLDYVNITSDSCFQALSSRSHAEAAKQAFDAAGKEGRIDYTGSVKEGHVLAGRADSEDGFETFARVGAGVTMPLWMRQDRSGTDIAEIIYGGGSEQDYIKAMNGEREQIANQVDQIESQAPKQQDSRVTEASSNSAQEAGNLREDLITQKEDEIDPNQNIA